MRGITVLTIVLNAKTQGAQNMSIQTMMHLNWTFKDISGYLGTIWKIFLTIFEHFVFLTILSNWLMAEKSVTVGRMHSQTFMRERIKEIHGKKNIFNL